MKRFCIAAAAAVMLAGPALAQAPARSLGEGPIEISAADQDLREAEGVVVYTGDVNVVRGGVRLRSDRLEAYFGRGETGGQELQRIVVEGEVYYVTEAEIARGDRGVYDLLVNTIELTGSVVLTRGCNVSTGERLFVRISEGEARLTGGGGGENQRVRSVFFTDERGEPTAGPQDCPSPDIPGEGPRPFDDVAEG